MQRLFLAHSSFFKNTFSCSLCDKILILQERADAEMEEIDSPEHALAIAEEAMDTSINDSQENQVQCCLK